MAFFRSQEEREQEARDREAADRVASASEAARREAQQAAANQAAFAAGPIGRARAAYERGDRFFQVQLEVSALTGYGSMFVSSQNEVTHREGTADVLGRIEDEGWRLEHTGFVFVETGATSTGRILGTGEGTVTEGLVMGVYLFRRAAG